MMSQLDRLEYYRKRYSQLRPGWMHATARYQALIARYIKPHFKILDLGCGRGGVVERLGGTGNWLGIDSDWDSLKRHRRSLFQRSCADAYALPLPKNSFDIVVSSWVMEHLPDPERFFQEIVRVLRSGGHFFFLTPNARHPVPWLTHKLETNLHAQHTLVRRLYNRLPADTFQVQYVVNTWQQIDALAIRAGLQLVDMEFVEDPSYLAWNKLTFFLSVLLENLLPAGWGIHIVGHYAYQP